MFSSISKKLIVSSMQRDFRKWNDGLRAGDGDEVGCVVASAAFLKDQYYQRGLDVLHPYANRISLEDVIILLGKEVRDFHKIKKPHLAAGVRVWHMTARAFSHIELRQSGREMWAELKRGFPFAKGGVQNIYEMTGDMLIASDYDVIPEGLSPRE